jgi:hypothetical protein
MGKPSNRKNKSPRPAPAARRRRSQPPARANARPQAGAGPAGEPGDSLAAGRGVAVPISRNGSGPQPAPGPPRRQRTALFNVTIVLAVATIVLLLGLAALYVFRKPLFAGNLFPVVLHNDGAVPVDVLQCGTNCTAKDLPTRLDPGGSIQVAAADDGLVTYYLHSLSGAVTGCLPLEFTRRQSGVTVQTSQAEPCPGTPITP